MERIRVVQLGLGPIGNQVTRYLLQREAFDLVGALDVAPEKEGRDVGELAGLAPVGVPVTSDWGRLAELGGSVAIVTTVSSLPDCRDQILRAVQAGLHVVSTCEELAYPWRTQPEIAAEIDEAATTHSVAVLGTGVNPGFLMDFLPIAMSGVCLDVRKIAVERIQDASRRRRPFQEKIGAGLSLAEFERRVREKTLRHVGLTESMHMIAARLGWTLDRTQDVVEPVVAGVDGGTGSIEIRRGDAIGVNQVGRGWDGDRELIQMVFRATIGEPDPHDRILIEGTPEIDLRVRGGINGDIATCAITVNAVPSVVAAAPGLHTMADLAPVSCFNASGAAVP